LTVIARLAHLMLDQAAAIGVDRDELMRESGLNPSEIKDPDGRIAHDKMVALWETLIRKKPGRALGVRLGYTVKVRDLGLVGYTMLYSRTLMQAVHRMARYSRVLNESLHLMLKRGVDHAHVVVEASPALNALKHPVEARLAGVLAAAREITASEIEPIEVHFPFERPDHASELEAFFRGTLIFDGGESMLVLRNEDLDRAVVAADETLIGYLDQLAEEAMRPLTGRENFTERARWALWGELSDGQPSLQRIGKLLGVSGRTLQRRLHEEGTSFAALLDDLRQRMAVRLLRDRELAIYEIAFLLGYSEPSTFHRAFHRWHDCTPQEFRRVMA
jgi:AraC-like DNA-binding protein